MTIASVGTAGTAANSTSGSSFTYTSTVACDAASGHFLLLQVVTDDIGAIEPHNNHHVSVTGGNGTWTKLHEIASEQISSNSMDGVATSLWLFVPDAANAASTVFTITLQGAVVDKCASAWRFTRDTSKNLVKAGQAAATVTANNNFGTCTISGLSSAHRLYFRSAGKEANSTTALTPTSGFTITTANRSRNNAAAVLTRGEFKIATSTGETSNPTLAVSGDSASVFVALEEQDPAPATNYVYRGSSSRASRYKGAKTDADLYKGSRGLGWV